MTAPVDPTAILAQINSARDQTYQNIALNQSLLQQAQAAAADAARDRAAVAAMAQQSVTVDTSVGTRVMAGDVMIHGDTGTRDVSTLLLNGWTSNWTRLRRVGATVFMNVYVRSVDKTADLMMVLPLGFRPAVVTTISIPNGSVAKGLGNFDFNHTSGNITFMPARSDSLNSLAGTFVFETPNLWPTSLPGTAA